MDLLIHVALGFCIVEKFGEDLRSVLGTDRRSAFQNVRFDFKHTNYFETGEIFCVDVD